MTFASPAMVEAMELYEFPNVMPIATRAGVSSSALMFGWWMLKRIFICSSSSFKMVKQLYFFFRQFLPGSVT